jgi:hypothetical protein
MSSVKKYEIEIMKQYEQGTERVAIVESIAREHNLTFVEAEPIVSNCILRHTGMVKI